MKKKHYKNGSVIPPEKIWVIRKRDTQDVVVLVNPLPRQCIRAYKLIGKYVLAKRHNVNEEIVRQRDVLVATVRELIKISRAGHGFDADAIEDGLDILMKGKYEMPRSLKDKRI